MARLRKISVAAINVALHDHSVDAYVNLFKALDKNNVTAKYFGDKYATLGALQPLRKDDFSRGIYGLIYRFTHIDTDGPWFNRKEKKRAEPDDLRTLSIPGGLGANLEMARFLFLPRGHTFYFETRTEDRKTFSPQSMESVIERMCQAPAIAKNFGRVETTVLPRADSLRKVLALPKMRTLIVQIKRPNPDHVDEDKILKRLRSQNLDRWEQVMTAAPRESIKPDPETRSLAAVAATNGYVSAAGVNHQGHRVHESTKDHPWIVDESYDPKTLQAGDVFLRVAGSMDETTRGR